MAKEKFVYKLGAVDRMIIGIILLACLGFAGLVYLDTNTVSVPNANSSSDVQNLLEEKARLEAEIERIKNEN